jgi:hypothetical protein
MEIEREMMFKFCTNLQNRKSLWIDEQIYLKSAESQIRTNQRLRSSQNYRIANHFESILSFHSKLTNRNLMQKNNRISAKIDELQIIANRLSDSSQKCQIANSCRLMIPVRSELRIAHLFESTITFTSKSWNCKSFLISHHVQLKIVEPFSKAHPSSHLSQNSQKWTEMRPVNPNWIKIADFKIERYRFVFEIFLIVFQHCQTNFETVREIERWWSCIEAL